MINAYDHINNVQNEISKRTLSKIVKFKHLSKGMADSVKSDHKQVLLYSIYSLLMLFFFLSQSLFVILAQNHSVNPQIREHR